MNKNYAIITAGLVSNIIEIDDLDTKSIDAFGAVPILAGQSVSMGWSYDGFNFAAPLPPVPPMPTLQQAKEIKKSAIRAAFEVASNANITVSGVVYQGGYDKAIRLDSAKRLAELAGQTSTVFYDLANVGHTLTIAQATSVVLAVSVAYQTEFTQKQARMIAINAATTVAAVEAIIF